MVIPVTCPCGRAMNAPDSLAGKNARCAYCGASVPVPGADASGNLTLICPCGRSLHAPESWAGKQVKCPACGAMLNVPEAGPRIDIVGEIPTLELPSTSPARKRRARRSRLRAQGSGLPGVAVAASIAAVVDSIGVVIVACLIVFAGWMVAGLEEEELHDLMSEAMDEKLETAEALIEAEGGEVLERRLDQDEDGTPAWVITWTTPEGERRTRRIPVSTPSRDVVREMRPLGDIIILVGILLLAVAGGKGLCAVGLIGRKAWGRTGLLVLCIGEGGLVTLLIMLGAAHLLLVASLGANIFAGVACISPRVVQYCR